MNVPLATIGAEHPKLTLRVLDDQIFERRVELLGRDVPRGKLSFEFQKFVLGIFKAVFHLRSISFIESRDYLHVTPGWLAASRFAIDSLRYKSASPVPEFNKSL